MKLSEILKERPLMEMGRPQKEVRRLIANYEDRLNEHVMKLILLPHHAAANGWRQECYAWCARIARQRMGRDERTGTPKFYFDLLFDAPFGSFETERLVGDLAKVIQDEFGLTDDLDLTEIVRRLRTFHENFAKACSAKAEPEELKRLISAI